MPRRTGQDCASTPIPDLDVTGTVDSLAPGTGAQFALLPAENATGNFTKIVQRVPVKIAIDRESLGGVELRPGLSAIGDGRYPNRAVRVLADHAGRAATGSKPALRNDRKDHQCATLRDWLAIAGGMVGCFMAILDIQITNSSLAPIEGGMGASVDEGSWISTAYLIAEIVVIPLTGWLGSSVFGLRRYLSVNTALFVLFSIGCAQSNSMIELILYRTGQGFTGGVLIPTGLTVIRRHLPPHQQAIGMSLFGVSATFAPAIGPIDRRLADRDISPGTICFTSISGPACLPSPCSSIRPPDREPMRLRETSSRRRLVGHYGTMAVGLAAMTIVLEEGQRHDWFGSPMISALAVDLPSISLIFFLIIELTSRHSRSSI